MMEPRLQLFDSREMFTYVMAGSQASVHYLSPSQQAVGGSCLSLSLLSSAQCPSVSGEARRGVFIPCLPQGAGCAATRH